MWPSRINSSVWYRRSVPTIGNLWPWFLRTRPAAAVSGPQSGIIAARSGCARRMSCIVAISLEPISKSSEEDNEAGELNKAEEVLSVVLPPDEDATLPLYPGEEALDEPAPHVTA